MKTHNHTTKSLYRRWRDYVEARGTVTQMTQWDDRMVWEIVSPMPFADYCVMMRGFGC